MPDNQTDLWLRQFFTPLHHVLHSAVFAKLRQYIEILIILKVALSWKQIEALIHFIRTQLQTEAEFLHYLTPDQWIPQFYLWDDFCSK